MIRPLLAALLASTLLTGCAAYSATRNEPALKGAATPAELRALRADLVEKYIRAGSIDLAVPLVREALADEPRSARLRTLLGAILLDRGLTGQAERESRSAIALDDKYAPAYTLLGRVEQRRGHPEAALDATLKATQLAPGCVRCWNNYGYTLFLAGKDREAIDAYEKALTLDPNARTVYNNLGFALGHLGEEKAALQAFRQAVNEDDAKHNLELCRQLRARTDASNGAAPNGAAPNVEVAQ